MWASSKNVTILLDDTLSGLDLDDVLEKIAVKKGIRLNVNRVEVRIILGEVLAFVGHFVEKLDEGRGGVFLDVAKVGFSTDLEFKVLSLAEGEISQREHGIVEIKHRVFLLVFEYHGYRGSCTYYTTANVVCR